MGLNLKTVVLVNGGARLATLSLSTAESGILVGANTLLVTARLGGLSLIDNSSMTTATPTFKHLLSIDGEEFADFRYETFDPNDKATYQGVKSSIMLKAGSLRLVFLEEPLRDIYRFAVKFAKLKGLYDAASQAAVQKASEFDAELMNFDVHVQSPIVIFPSDPAKVEDGLTIRLGEITAKNGFEKAANKTQASLRGVSLTSSITYSGVASKLRIIADIDVFVDVCQAAAIDREVDVSRPDLEVRVMFTLR